VVARAHRRDRGNALSGGIGAVDTRYSPIPFPNRTAAQNDGRIDLGTSEPPVKRMSAPAVAAGTLLALATLPAVAHHGTLISYDRDQQWTRDAVVTEFHYANPHPQLFFDVTDEQGNVVHWSAEMLPNPAGLLRVGWTKVRSLDALAPGKTVKVTIAPARAGGTVGLLLKVTNLEGAEIVSDSVPYPQPASAPQP
jgi:hypothetical protein